MKKANTYQPFYLAVIICLLFSSFGSYAVSPASAQNIRAAAGNAELEELARDAFLSANPGIDPEEVFVSDIREDSGWAMGLVGSRATDTVEEPMLALFLAQVSDAHWVVAMDGSEQFNDWIANVPNSLVSDDVKSVLTPSSDTTTGSPVPNSAGNGSNLLSLPWATGETWKLTGGPHSNSGSASEVWSSLDFQGPNRSGKVRAARDGVAWVSSACPNYVLVTHPDGIKTGYYHLINISVGYGQSLGRGAALGDISSSAGCGGYATGPHVHFSLRNSNNNKIAINGIDLGGWTVQNGANQYEGCLQRVSDGARVCQWGSIYNDGTIGSGTPVTPPGDVVIVNPPALTPAYSGDMCGSAWNRFAGYNGQYAYLTLNTNQVAKSTNSGVWQPNLAKTGTYRVEAYIANHNPIDWQCPSIHIGWDTSDARYTINHASGSTTISRDQAPLNNQWLSLGDFTFNAGTGGSVRLVDLNGESHLSKTISFSAMRFTLLSITDTAAPKVNAITVSYVNGASIVFDATFTENVLGVDAGDFNLTTDKVSGASIASVSGSGDHYKVTVNAGSGNGTIRLDVLDNDTIVDGAGNKLGGAGLGNGNFTSGQVYTLDKKTPVVFVHGWNGFPPQLIGCTNAKYDPVSAADAKGYFQGVGDKLKTDGGYSDNKIFYARLVSNRCYTPSLVDNVPNLMAAIDEAKSKNTQAKVILIGHSMGGLVARAYIEGPLYRNDVEALLTFGSPHLGTPEDGISFLFNGLSFGKVCKDIQPAVCDFSVTGMVYFNATHHKNANITYHAISGDAPFFSRSPLGMVMDKLIPGPDDGIVPTDSGRAALLGSFDRWTTDEVHGPGAGGFGDRTYFIRNGGTSLSYTQCIKKVLVDGAANCGGVSIAATAQDTPTAMAQHTPIVYGTLLPGQSATRSISMEAGPALFDSQWQDGSLSFKLIDPNGVTIDPAYAAANPGLVTYTVDVNGAAYYFPLAGAGTWQLVSQAVSVPAGGASFSTFSAFDSSVALSGSTNSEWYAPASSATISATLDGLPASATVSASIRRSDGLTDTLPLAPTGGGKYQAVYSVPNAPGYTEVRLTATGLTASSQTFERGALLSFQISPNTFLLSNTYSDALSSYPEPSLYKFLKVTAGINAAVSGKVGLSGDLVDSGGNLVAHSAALKDASAGANLLTLQFKGQDIFASKHNGPYTLTNLLVTDESGATLVTQQAQAVYITASYLYSDFAGPNSFTDVPTSYWSWSWVERLYSAGITTGCGTGTYCPDDGVTRSQMAIFLLRGEHGAAYTPPAASGTKFLDVPANYWAAPWIEQLAAEGITSGCGPAGYCPDASVTRAEMAIFLLRGKYGSTYAPPAPSGVFKDVPANYWAAAWIEQLAAEGITSGCGTGTYCPDNPVTRAQMAVFLVRAFNLPDSFSLPPTTP